jgi:hypothetical protein
MRRRKVAARVPPIFRASGLTNFGFAAVASTIR